MNPLLRMAIGAANTFLVIATGRNVHAVTAVAPLLIKHASEKAASKERVFLAR